MPAVRSVSTAGCPDPAALDLDALVAALTPEQHAALAERG
jgi:hypothetical protein